MKSYKSCQHQRILLEDKTIAHGEYIVDSVTIRIKNGYLDDSVDEDGNAIPAVESETGSHIEHWRNGVLHCETGLAIIDQVDGYEEWWLNGKQVTNDVEPLTVCEPTAKYSSSKSKKPVIDMTATGARIKELRLKSKLSVSEVQSMLGLTSPEAIYKWEKGKYMPSIDNCLALASIFGVRVEDLIATNEIEI